MSAPHSDQIIDGYLARLRGALTGLPAPRQQELLDDVRRHLAEAREPLGAPARKPTGIGILEIGALVPTRFVWPIGVILLWTSSPWNTRDKLIGTLVPPGGSMGIVLLLPSP